MKYFVSILLLSFLFSCSTAPPTDAEVKEKVKLWYMQQAVTENANVRTVEGVTVLSIKKDAEHKGVFDAVCIASGTSHRSSSTDSLTDLKFYDTVKISLEWNGAKWVSVKE
jgi:hypothetical protein